jgi:hypothetical protein
MGVVPAWLAWPVKRQAERVWPTMAVTAATLRPPIRAPALLDVDLDKAHRICIERCFADFARDRGRRRESRLPA